jgi:tetratricopeptide (TPR) repeat protein
MAAGQSVMTRFLVLLLVCATFRNAAIAAEHPVSEFDRANKLYEQGRFAEALGVYSQIAERVPAPAVWFNLGNAAYKAGHIGEAIRAYRIAEQINPRDTALRANLQFARTKVYANEREHVPWWKIAVRLATINEWAVVSAVLFWVFFFILMAGELAGKRYPGIAGGCLGLWLLVTAGLVLALQDRLTPQAVVVASEATVRRGPLEESHAAFQLRDGAELLVLSAKEQWIHVRDVEGRPGWVRRDALALLPGAKALRPGRDQ